MKRSKLMTNCPNCGAVITGDKCEYCGTYFGTKFNNDKIIVQTKPLNMTAEEIAKELNRWCKIIRGD